MAPPTTEAQAPTTAAQPAAAPKRTPAKAKAPGTSAAPAGFGQGAPAPAQETEADRVRARAQAPAPYKGDGFVQKSGVGRQLLHQSTRPKGPTRKLVVAHGEYSHAEWGTTPSGQEVVTGRVILKEGDEVELTETEIRRLDPKGQRFVTADRYRKMKAREELEAEERADALKLIAAEDPNAPVPRAPIDRLLGDQHLSDTTPTIVRT